MSAWGLLASGAGHFALPIMLFISPIYFGLIFWPLWGWLAADFDSSASKGLFIFTMLAHFIGLGVVIAMERDSQWFVRGLYSMEFLLSLTTYVLAQVFLWGKFVRSLFPRRAGSS